MSKKRSDTTQIMREQMGLFKTQQELREMILNINNHLNQLCVERLQLQSCEISRNIPRSTATATETAHSMNQLNNQLDNILDIAVINKQSLNLLTNKSNNPTEEDEEDDN